MRGRLERLANAAVEPMTDVKQIVEPLVQRHIHAPSPVELGAAASGELAQLVVAMPIPAADRLREACIVVDTQRSDRGLPP